MTAINTITETTRTVGKTSKWAVATGHFTSLSAFGDYLQDLHARGMKGGEADRHDELRAHDEPYSWAGHTLPEALEVLTNGGYWPEGAEKLQRVQLSDKAQTSLRAAVKRTSVRSVTGGGLSVGEYLSGAPDCMRARVRRTQQIQAVRIDTSAFLSGGLKEHHMLNMGRAVLAVIEALEAQGLSVELNHRLAVVAQGSRGKAALDVTVALKQAGEQWSPSSVVYALTHVSMFRRCTFRLVEAFKTTLPLEDGMGHPDAIAQYIGKTAKDADLALPPLHVHNAEHFDTPDNALAYVLRQLRKQQPHLLTENQEAA